MSTELNIEEGTECTNCSNVVYDDLPMCNECRWVSKDTLEEWFDDWLDQTSDSIKILGMYLDPSVVLKECDPIAYRTALADYADSLAQDGRTVEGYTD
jgi:hypothetical protein